MPNKFSQLLLYQKIWIGAVVIMFMAIAGVVSEDIGLLAFVVFVLCGLYFLFGLVLSPFAKKVGRDGIAKALSVEWDEQAARLFIEGFTQSFPLSPDEEDAILDKCEQKNGSYSRYEIMRRLLHHLETCRSGSKKRFLKMMGVRSLEELKIEYELDGEESEHSKKKASHKNRKKGFRFGDFELGED